MNADRDDDLSREIGAHLELEAEERIADGLSAEDARSAARRAFGNITRAREDARAVWVPVWLEQGRQDLRHAARRLRRAPAFTATAILILTIGIGLNLGFFQLLNVVVLRPLAVADIDSLVRFDRVTKRFSSNGIPYPATQFVRRHNDVLSSVLTSTSSDLVWGDDANDRVPALYVSANWFTELGYGAVSGRLFAESVDEVPAASPGIVVSYDFWQQRLQGEPVVGRTVRINTRPATILGVVPRGFPGLRLSDTQVWLLIHQIEYFNPGMSFTDDWAAFNTQMYGRLRPGISPAAAKAGLTPTIREMARLRPGEFEPDESLEPRLGLQSFRSPRDRQKLWTIASLISGLMIVVLVVACANLSGLILSHTMSRLRELGVRTALGASRWRVLRQQFVEAAFLSVLGTAGGLLAGYWCARAVAMSIALPGSVDLAPDWRVALAACLTAVIATMSVGAAPAWVAGRGDILGFIRDGSPQTSRGFARSRLRLVLVASQVAGCCILLIVAGFTLRSLRELSRGELGFDFKEVAVLDAALPRLGIGGEAARSYWTDVKRALEGTADVEQVALASQAPFGDSGGRSVYNDAPRLRVSSLVVEPSFFTLLRIPILVGRNFESADPRGSVAIVSRRLALEMYGSLDVLGKGFPKSSGGRTIVGVAGDAPLVNATSTNSAQLYTPVTLDRYAGLVLLARARTTPERLLTPLRDAARAADPRVLPRTLLPISQFEEHVQGRRVAGLLASATGLVSLALACIGIFGLVAHGVSMRMKEIGIRRALGAGRAAVIAIFFRQLAIPVAIGMLIGTIAGVAAGRILEGEPFHLAPGGLFAPTAALFAFMIAAGAAAIAPAFRALGVEPLQALRNE